MAIVASHPVMLSNAENISDPNITINTYPSMSTGSRSSPTDDGPFPTATPSTLACRPIDKTKVIRVLQKSECKQAGLALAQAFKDDDLAKYFTHTEDRKHCTETENWDLHVFIMQCIVKAHVNRGMATVIGDDYDCVALW